MKKFICITLSIAMIFTLLCVPVSFASDEGVENAILTAKNLLEISDDEYVIDDFSQYDGDYQLTWKNRDEDRFQTAKSFRILRILTAITT